MPSKVWLTTILWGAVALWGPSLAWSQPTLSRAESQGYHRSVDLASAKYPLPDVKITGPDSVRSGGRMVVVKANLDKSQLPDNLISVKYQWAVLVNGKPHENVLVWYDSSQIIFDSPEKEEIAGNPQVFITVVMDVDCLFGVTKTADDKTVYENVELVSSDLITKAIEVTDDGRPGPGPGPNPDPPTPQPVDPTFPPGRFGLAEFFYQTFKIDTSLTPAEKAALASALASSYKGIASKIAAISTYTDLVTILTDTATYNKAAVTASGVPREKTLAINKAIGDKIYELTAAKDAKILTANDIKDAWNEIVVGLSAVK